MKQTQYVAREPDAHGFIDYPQQEHAVWNTLITRQLKVIEGRACQEYLDGIDQLKLPHDRIPQLGEVNTLLLLQSFTGQQSAKLSLVDARNNETISFINITQLVGPAPLAQPTLEPVTQTQLSNP